MQAQLRKEALWALLLTLIYLIGWMIFAYFMPQGRGWIGFPIWFEWSCIYFPLVFVGIAWFTIKKIYKNVPLEQQKENDDE